MRTDAGVQPDGAQGTAGLWGLYSNIRFGDACRRVRACKRVTLGEARDRLRIAQITATSARVLNDYDPTNLMGLGPIHIDMWPGEQQTYGSARTTSDYINEMAFEALEQMFPCDRGIMEDNLLNFEGGGFGISIYPPLKDYSYEGFMDMVTTPEHMSNHPLGSLMCFVAYLDFGVDSAFWPDANDHFNWNLEDWPVTSYNRSAVLDKKKFYRCLSRRGILDDYKVAFDAHWGMTDNLFLDESFDEMYDEYIPYTIENVTRLEKEWRAAQNDFERIRCMAEKAAEKTWIYDALVQAWNYGCMPKREYKRKGTRLMEVFDAESN